MATPDCTSTIPLVDFLRAAAMNCWSVDRDLSVAAREELVGEMVGRVAYLESVEREKNAQLHPYVGYPRYDHVIADITARTTHIPRLL